MRFNFFDEQLDFFYEVYSITGMREVLLLFEYLINNERYEHNLNLNNLTNDEKLINKHHYFCKVYELYNPITLNYEYIFKLNIKYNRLKYNTDYKLHKLIKELDLSYHFNFNKTTNLIKFLNDPIWLKNNPTTIGTDLDFVKYEIDFRLITKNPHKFLKSLCSSMGYRIEYLNSQSENNNEI